MVWQASCFTYQNHPAMPQITLSVPNEKLPMLQEFLQALGIEGQQISSLFNGRDKKNNRKNTTTTGQPFSWEYYRNELEFE